MKKLLLIAAILAAPMAQASDACEKIKNVVLDVHESRYKNIPADVMWDKYNASESYDYAKIIHEVYTQSKYSTKAKQKEQRVQIASKYFLWCEHKRSKAAK